MTNSFFSSFSNYQKTFQSLFCLSFKDKKISKMYDLKYANSCSLISEKISKFIMIYIILICLIELAFIPGYSNRNIKWNFIFSIMNLVIYLLNYYLNNSKENYYLFIKEYPMTIFSNLILMFCFYNINLSIISLLLVTFKTSLEFISLIFCAQMLIKFFVSFFVIKGFRRSLLIIFINHVFQFCLLNAIHVNKEVFIYLITDIFFSSITLSIVYLMEYFSKVLFVYYLKLSKEKEYYIETLNFFNISYFKSINYEIIHQTKMEEILLGNYLNSSFVDEPLSFKHLENMINSKLISSETEFPPYVANYIKNCSLNKNFNFKDFVDFLSLNKEKFFHQKKKFKKFGIIKIQSESTKQDERYLEMFIKIELKNCETELIENDKNIISLINRYKQIKIEGMFIDVTQNFLRKQTQTDSLILSKYIHDIKTPLFLLKMMLSDYKNSISKICKQNEQLSNEIEVNSTISEIKIQSYNLNLVTKNIFKLIQNINMFTKKQNSLNSEENANNKSNVNIRKLIKSVVDFYKISAKYKSESSPSKYPIKVSYQIDNKVPQFIFTMKNALRQVLMNLVSNSMKFTNFGEITIKAQVKSKYELEKVDILEIAVCDTGVGIDEENISKISSPFKLTTDLKGGSGLGLSIVKDFLEMIGSQLNVYSKKNKGSCFQFEIVLNQNVSNEDSEDCNSNLEDNNFADGKEVTTNIINNISDIEESINTALNFEIMLKPSEYIILCEEFEISENSFQLETKTDDKLMRILIIDDDCIYGEMLSNTMKSLSEELNCTIIVDYVSSSIEGLNKIYTNFIYENKCYHLLLIDENLPYMKGTEFIQIYNKLVLRGLYKISTVSISGDISDEKFKDVFNYLLGKPSKKGEVLQILKSIVDLV